MNASRFYQTTPQWDQVLAKLAGRGGCQEESPETNPLTKGEAVREAFNRHFSASDDEEMNLKDEFSAKEIERVVSDCQALLKSLRGTNECWRQIGDLLDRDLWKFIRLKEELADTENKVMLVRRKLEEISEPLDGVVNETKLMACSMLLAREEMVCENLQQRISMIIDQFVARILAGTQHTPGGEILELRLRGVFGSR